MEIPTLQQLSYIIKNPSTLQQTDSRVFLRKFGASLLFLTIDITLLAFALFSSIYIRNIFLPGQLDVIDYYSVIPLILPLFLIAYYFRGLYPGFGIDAIEELRTLTYSTTIVFAILASLSFLVKGAWEYSRLAFLLSWLMALPLIPLGRAFIKKMFGTKSWWGVPVIIIGAGRAGEHVIKSLQKHKHIGLRPVVAVDDDVDRWGYIHHIPVIGGLEIVPELAGKLNIDHSIIAMPGVSRKRQQEIIINYSKYFSSTTVIPELFGLSSLWVSSRDLGGILGLEVQQRLLKKSARFRKRIFDIVLASGLLVVLSPVYFFVSMMIKLDSKGRILFRQKRMGRNDSRFKIVKFRTMHQDAEDRLNAILNENEDLKAEYEIFHKLRNDPRLTRFGKFLRKYSLDELPQFLNVIKGEMSLIGPRAYMPWEKVKMNGMEEVILKVKPGISGLWQVTDRNRSSFEERNITDVYYIRNWSMFLDLYILARTIAVVVTGKGG